MSFAAVRNTVAAELQAYVPSVAVESEPPDSLVPPAYVVRWDGTIPSSAAIAEHSISIECWPSSDLTAAPHFESRDSLLMAAIELTASLQLPGCAVVGWRADADQTRELGQQTVRIAVVTVLVHEPMMCLT